MGIDMCKFYGLRRKDINQFLVARSMCDGSPMFASDYMQSGLRIGVNYFNREVLAECEADSIQKFYKYPIEVVEFDIVEVKKV